MLSLKSLGWALTIIVMSTAIGSAQQSGPSLLDPHAAMEVRPQESSKDLREKAVTAYQATWGAVDEYEEAATKNALESINAKRITTTTIGLIALEWYALQLIARGEPAGHDFLERRAALTNRVGQVIRAYKRLPDTKSRLERAFDEFVNLTRKYERVRQTSLTLGQKDEWIKADETLQPPFAEIQGQAWWYTMEPTTRDLTPFTRPYGTARETIAPRADAIRRKDANAELIKAREALTPKFSELLSQLQSGDSATRGESGPQRLVRFTNEWQAAQLAAIQCIGLDMARIDLEPREAGPNLVALAQEQQKFATDAVEQIVKLISDDAARVSPGEARRMYQDYVVAVTPLILLGDRAELTVKLQSTLDALVTRSPDLQIQVEAYRAASEDLLRWRERVANSYTKRQADTFPPLPETFVAAAMNSKDERERLFQPISGTEQATLNGPGSITATVVGKLLQGKNVHTLNLIGARNGSGFSISEARNSVFARCSFPIDTTTAAEELQTALLVQESSPPLTLAASVAIESARRGDLMSIGGTISNIVIEGKSSKLANISDSDWGYVRLAKIPDSVTASSATGTNIKNVVVRVEIEPTWARHQYFFLSN